MATPSWSYLDGQNPTRAFPGATASERVANQLPSFAKMVRGADGVLRKATGFGATAGTAAARGVPVVGQALAVGGEALDVMDMANDPNATGADVAQRTAEGVGRVGGMIAGGGIGAAGGSVFGPIGTAIGGVIGGTAGYLAPNLIYKGAEMWRNRGMKPRAAPEAAPVPVPQAGPYQGDLPLDPAGFGVVAAPVAEPAFAPIDPFTRADVRGARVPVSGTGAFVNARGVVTNLDTRAAQVTDAELGAVPRADGSIGSYVGAIMNQRQAASTEARKLARDKLIVDAMGKGATAAEAAAKADQIGVQTQAAREHLKRNPGDYAGAAAVAAGRVLPAGKFTVPFPPMDDKSPITVLNTGNGDLQRRQAVQPITMAQAVASAKKNGTYRTDAQVRADIMKMPAYKLID